MCCCSVNKILKNTNSGARNFDLTKHFDFFDLIALELLMVSALNLFCWRLINFLKKAEKNWLLVALLMRQDRFYKIQATPSRLFWSYQWNPDCILQCSQRLQVDFNLCANCCNRSPLQCSNKRYWELLVSSLQRLFVQFSQDNISVVARHQCCPKYSLHCGLHYNCSLNYLHSGVTAQHDAAQCSKCKQPRVCCFCRIALHGKLNVKTGPPLS